MSDIRYKTSTQIAGISAIHRSLSHNQNTDITVKTLQRWQIHDQYTDVRMITRIQISEASPVYICQISKSKPVHRYQCYHKHAEVRIITSAQISESLLVHRYQNDHQCPDVRDITSTQMSDIRFKTST